MARQKYDAKPGCGSIKKLQQVLVIAFILMLSMANFIRQIVFGNKSFEFHFSRIAKDSGYKYHVRVKDSLSMHHFTMEKMSDQWHIIQAPAPEQWILVLEKDLVKSILDYENTL